MPKSSSELVSLFQSLQPDSTAHRAAHSTSADAAAQRWPLLNNLAPKKLNPTPALTDADRARWNNQDHPESQTHKSALSLPAAAGDMALSLQRMAAHAVSVPPVLKPDTKPSTAPMVVPPAQPEATAVANSLKQIFNRLEGKSAQPDTKPASFWTRLGRR